MPTAVSQRARGIVAAVITEVLYGSSFVFTKHATDVVDPFTLLGWRFVTALAVLLVLVVLRVVRLRITRASLPPLLLLAGLQPLLYYVGETYGVARTTASESGLVISSIPVVALLASALVLHVHPTRPQLVGVLVTLAGVVATVIAGGVDAGFDPLGYAFLLLAVVAYSLYAVFADRFSDAPGLDKTFVMVASGAVLFGGITLGQHAHDHTLGHLAALPLHDHRFLVSVLVLALGPTISAFFLQNVAIAELGTNRYATFIGLSALVAVLCAVVALGERPSAVQLAGGVLILLGVYRANRDPHPGAVDAIPG